MAALRSKSRALQEVEEVSHLEKHGIEARTKHPGLTQLAQSAAWAGRQGQTHLNITCAGVV